VQLAWANLSLVHVVTWTQPINGALAFADEAIVHRNHYGLDVLAHTLVAAANAYAVVDEAAAAALLARAHALAADDDDLITIDCYFAGQRAFTGRDYELAARTWRDCIARMGVRPSDYAVRWPDRRTAYVLDAMAGLVGAQLCRGDERGHLGFPNRG
jgi:hypothetical protein